MIQGFWCFAHFVFLCFTSIKEASPSWNQYKHAKASTCIRFSFAIKCIMKYSVTQLRPVQLYEAERACRRGLQTYWPLLCVKGKLSFSIEHISHHSQPPHPPHPLS